MSQSIQITGNGNTVTAIGRDVYGTVNNVAHAPGDGRPTEVEKDVVLFAAADPQGLMPLRLAEEAREILAALHSSPEGARFDFEQRTAVRVPDLSAALCFLRPRFVHFSGHGESDGSLCLQDEKGEVQSVPPHALGMMFDALQGATECVVLNACWSRAQALEIVRSVPYVVGMRHEIGDRAAIAFAVGFYQAIAAGLDVPVAHKAGCAQIAAMNLPEHLTPELFVRDAAG
jgi:hypothetical protein